MNTWQAIVLVVFLLLLLNSVLLSPGLARLALQVGLPSWLGWVPILNTLIVPRAADCSLFSWVLVLVPLVNIYVWFDWWAEIAFDKRHGHPDLFAAGMFVPVLSTYLLGRFNSSSAHPQARAQPA